MVVFGSKSSSVKIKLFEQPLDKLLSPKSLKQFHEAVKKTKQNQLVQHRDGSLCQLGITNKFICQPFDFNCQPFELNKRRDLQDDDGADERCRQLMMSVLPEPIKRLLAELYLRGPSTVGIFRKSPNAKHCKELRQKLETSDGYTSIENFHVNVIASVFKEWLRSLPDCLLMSQLYPQWIDTAKLIEPIHLRKLQQQQHQDINVGAEHQIITDASNQHQNFTDARQRAMIAMSQFELRERHSECIRIVRQLLDALNETNLILLRAIVCVLWHISKNCELNKMCSNNLGVCIGQSLLNDEHQRKKSHRSSSLGLYSSMHSNQAINTSPSPALSALKSISASTFSKRHRRTRSQSFLASTLSLTNLSSHLSSLNLGNTDHSTMNFEQQQKNHPTNYLASNDAQEAAKYVPILVAFMIDNAKSLFGSHIVNLFGPRPEDEQQHSQSLDSNSSIMQDSNGNDSSTSGVHSESPTFSSEPDSNHNDWTHRTPTSCSSYSVSLSSPDPSSHHTDQYSSLANYLHLQGRNCSGGSFESNDDIHLHPRQRQQPQPTTAATAYQSIRPRLARIRSNRFNKIYVKRASSPYFVTVPSDGNNHAAGLVVRPLSDLEASTPKANVARSTNLMGLSHRSLSQRSFTMSSASQSTEHSAEDDDESDDSSTGEWVESSMV